ncbi:MAG: hypothetical protein WC834_03215 [Eubacteriales bacterium]
MSKSTIELRIPGELGYEKLLKRANKILFKSLPKNKFVAGKMPVDGQKNN